MTAIETIGNYNYIGDIVTLMISLTIFVMIRQSLFFATETNFKLYKRALIFVVGATLFNMANAYICQNYPDYIWTIFLTRIFNHILLMSTFLLFIFYVRNQLELKEKRRVVVTRVSKIVVGVAIMLDFLAPLTHFGFYYSGEAWHDNTYLQPFAITYIYVITILGIMITFWGDKLVMQIRRALVIVGIMCIAILLVENSYHTNILTSFTFVLPMLTVLMMLHSKPYDTMTGALDVSAFEEYMSYSHDKKIERAYVILQICLDVSQVIPEEIARAIHSEWYGYFKDTELFCLKPGLFLLSIPTGVNENDTSKIKDVVDGKFSSYYEKFKIPFKLLIVEDGSFIESYEDAYATVNITTASMKMNEIHYLSEKEKAGLIQGKKITKQIKDIDEKCDLNDERVLVYCQPIKNMDTGKFTTGEALMRLKLPELGMVFPDRFIPIAESSGCLHSLSKIILNKTCAGIRRYLDAGYDIERVSVNFSIAELRDENFCDDIISIIKANEVPFYKIAIELTESQNDNDYELVKNKIAELKKYGINFYLDDYGTGYSNFDRVVSLGIDLVKFDRSLILLAEENAAVAATMRLFSESFRRMNYKILFEGIETGEHEELCKECNADYLQGFKYSKPVPFDEIDLWSYGDGDSGSL